jgi:hypothetical protein
MKHMNIIALLIATVAFAGCSNTQQTAAENAQEGTEAQQQLTTSSESDSDALVCKRVTKTGTRFSTKVCYTQEEYAAQQKASQQVHTDNINRSSRAAALKPST